MELAIPDRKSAWQIQNRMSEFCKNRLRGAIDRVLSDISPPGRFWRIDRLELDLGDLSSDSLEEDFLENFERRLRNAMDEELAWMRAEENARRTMPANTSGSFSNKRHVDYNLPPGMAGEKSRSLSAAERDLEIVLFFLETGALPWFALGDEPGGISEKFARLFRELPDQIRPVLANQLKNPVSRKRLVCHLDEVLFKKALFLVSPDSWFTSSQMPFVLIQIAKDIGISDFPKNALKHLVWDKTVEYAVVELPQEQAQLSLFNAVLSMVASRVPEKAGEFLEKLEDASSKGLLGNISAPLVRHLAFLRQTFARIAETGRVGELFNGQVWRSKGEKQNAPIHPEKRLVSFPRIEGQVEQAESEPPRPTKTAVPCEEHPTPTVLKADGRRPDSYEFRERQTQSHKQWETPRDQRPGFSLYVRNAGLVIFHPYLSRFFETLGLTMDGRFENDSCRARAALVLQRLAGAKPNPPEYLLPLNKILCGLDIYEPFPCDIPLTENEIKECEKLLETVVQHWAALKNTSAEGLRRSFVRREGVLGKEDGNWRLRVERKSFDLLLEKLPWGFSMIKLSWMKSLLFVEW